MTKKVYAMVIAAHPDDPEFGAAGTVARWTGEGKDVVFVICTNGDKGAKENIKPEDLAKIREQEEFAAAKMLGVKEVIFMRYPDQGLEETSDFRKEIVRLIRMYRPEVILTSDPYRRYLSHRDHRIVGQVTLDAIFPGARDLLAYPDLTEQGLLPHKVKEVLLWGSDEPNYRSDITKTFDLKIAALHCHRSQVGDNLDGLRERMRQRARMMAEGEKFELAEVFHCIEAPG
ncbi:MAG: PIG-L deacetylase family protein [Chloroflexota bacterium]